MGATTKIAWTDHTFNIAWGCVKVSPGCKNCYADTASARFGHSKIWGPPATTDRRTFGEKHWREPFKWNREAEVAGVRHKVFSSSMCDVAEDHPTIEAQWPLLWQTIRNTPWLDWQLLTKRHDRLETFLPDDWSVKNYPNVWLGVSVENQDYADIRIPSLLKIDAAVRFVSYEPALGPVDFTAIPLQDGYLDALQPPHGVNGLDWIIYGGESGPGYRPEDKQWARDVRDACRASGVAFFHKQSAAPRTEMGIELDGVIVREFPTPRAA